MQTERGRRLSSYLSARQRSLLRSTARLVLLLLILQLFALDHWPAGVDSIVGIENSSAHVQHCHGDSGGCADATAQLTLIDGGRLALIPPAFLRVAFVAAPSARVQSLLSVPGEPPRPA